MADAVAKHFENEELAICLQKDIWKETNTEEIIVAFDFPNLRKHPIAVTLKNLMGRTPEEIVDKLKNVLNENTK